MSHPIPGHDYSEQHNQETNKEYRKRRHEANKPKGRIVELRKYVAPISKLERIKEKRAKNNALKKKMK